MVTLQGIRVWCQTDVGEFDGSLDFYGGLEVVSARNSFGKSMAARAFAWCLGLEPIFGAKAHDAACLPLALREELHLDAAGTRKAKVLASRASISLLHADGRSIELTREIKGGDLSTVLVEEIGLDGTRRRTKLLARTQTMKDESGGLQRFLFDWLGWPRAEVATYEGDIAEIYLENIAPLFYIEQEEGWSHLQSRQVTRYAQQQIQQVVIEYMLGAMGAVEARVARQRYIFKESALREGARGIEERVTGLWVRNGWSVPWSSSGSLADIISRWSARSLRETLQHEANVDLGKQGKALAARVERLRDALTTDPIDAENVSAHAAASQRVIDLKRRRHDINRELSVLRAQQRETSEILESIEHRIRAGSDVLRLKQTGVGRLEVVECPTCHRHIDPESFDLTEQSEESVAAHVSALKRDRQLISSSLLRLRDRLTGLDAERKRIDVDFLAAERELMGVTAAVGPVREQLARAAAELSSAERKLDRLAEVGRELGELQREVDSWIRDALQLVVVPEGGSDLAERVGAFESSLRKYLSALGHSAVNENNLSEVRLDELYVPFLGERRLQTLGSASDGPRMIAAYVLALAAASRKVGGFHPGFVILDEPLQQNPDSPHRELFVDFLAESLAQETDFQVVILTFLAEEEVIELRRRKTAVQTPPGEYLLRAKPPTPERDTDLTD